MSKMLDKSRSYQECIPVTPSGCAYIQDWIMYDGQGMRLPRDKQEHLNKQAATVPPAVPADEDDEPDDGSPNTGDMAGPIDPDQNFPKLRKEIRERLGVNVKNKVEAIAAIEDAGLMP